MRKGGLLSVLMILGLAAGACYGQYILRSPVASLDEYHWTRTLGEFTVVRPFTLLALPMAFVGMAVGAASVASMLRMSLMCASTLVFFLASTLLAVSVGLFAADRWQPGALPPVDSQALINLAQQSLDASPTISSGVRQAIETGAANPGGAWMEIVRSAVPFNIVSELGRGNVLAALLLALLLGMGLAAGGERTASALATLRGLMEALLIITRWLAWLTPIGVAALAAYCVGRIGFESLRGPLEKFVVIVAASLGFHAFLALPIIMLVLARSNPLSFLWRVRPPLLLGLGTASSTATLALAVHNGHEAGCSTSATGFVMPLGTAIHRCGTAQFQAIAAVFLCQVYGLPLEFSDYVIIAITAVLASIAATGVPGAGLVTLVIVMSALNTSLAGRGVAQLPVHALGILVGIDLLLDMVRTMVNVWGNLVGARIMSQIAPDPAHQPSQ